MGKFKAFLLRLLTSTVSSILDGYKSELTNYLDNQADELAEHFYEQMEKHVDITHERFGDNIQEYKQGYARVEPDDTVVLFNTSEAGKLGGIIDFSEIHGPSTARVELYFYIPNDKTGTKDLKRMRSTEIKRDGDNFDAFSPIMSIFESYSAYGGEVRLIQTGGVSAKYYYNLYRRD